MSILGAVGLLDASIGVNPRPSWKKALGQLDRAAAGSPLTLAHGLAPKSGATVPSVPCGHFVWSCGIPDGLNLAAR